VAPKRQLIRTFFRAFFLLFRHFNSARLFPMKLRDGGGKRVGHCANYLGTTIVPFAASHRRTGAELERCSATNEKRCPFQIGRTVSKQSKGRLSCQRTPDGATERAPRRRHIHHGAGIKIGLSPGTMPFTSGRLLRSFSPDRSTQGLSAISWRQNARETRT
jgi:hypothetical protein